MKFIKKTIEINTNSSLQILDITNEIQNILKLNKVNNGIINIFTKHSTSAIVINENERGLLNDFENLLKTLIPQVQSYEHNRIDNNADAHLRSFFLSSSETVPIYNGKLDLGTWQSIFFVELDGPRNNRKINLSILVE